MGRTRIPLILSIALLLTLPAWSAPPRPMRDPRTERVIEALLIWRLVDEVRLSDQQIARIFPRIKALKDLRIELGIRRVVLQRELRVLVREQPRDEDLIRARIAELDALRSRIERERTRILQDIHAALTLEQRARFALIEETFEAETLRTLEEVRRSVEEQRRRR
jgi:Spy/CpxP family protein refolding chaperone